MLLRHKNITIKRTVANQGHVKVENHALYIFTKTN